MERIEFDVEQSSLRLNGRNVEENEHLKMGQYHTLELEIGHPVGIEKDCWVIFNYIFILFQIFISVIIHPRIPFIYKILMMHVI